MPTLWLNNNRRRGDFLNSLGPRLSGQRLQCLRSPKAASPRRAAAAPILHTGWCPRGREVGWRLPPPAAPCLRCPGLAPCCPFPLLFLTEQPHTYVIPTAPKTTRTGCCPSRSVRSTLGRASRPPAATAATAGPACLPAYLSVYLVWSSFVRTSPASRNRQSQTPIPLFAAIVSCL